jgi:hypothetical protein
MMAGDMNAEKMMGYLYELPVELRRLMKKGLR